jgi:hypothetical protein
MSCFANGGECSINAPQPYCVCGFWVSDGQFSDCTSLFAGDLVLFVVLGVLALTVVLFAVFKLRSCRQDRQSRLKKLAAYENEDETLLINH